MTSRPTTASSGPRYALPLMPEVMFFNQQAGKMIKSEKFWDKQSNNFDKRSKKLDRTEIKTIENTKKYLNIGDIVLDYGCATGAMAFEIADNVKKIHGIAISQKMIGAAKFDESYKKENFDVILAFNILHSF